ncbi:hypothetical protein ACFPYN_03010 [Paenisporosarcina macmurdoensis]|uniref:Transposase n=1 Tax=Paenisporosarcina macmurdoensis TaxID=212659 RepID=A0ABW1L5J5_9BACL
MIIFDNSREYETTYIEELIRKEGQRTSVERDILNAFMRHAYYLFHRIRDCVNTRKCRKMKPYQVRERLEDANRLSFTMSKMNMNASQLDYIITFNQKYNKAVQ